MCQGCVANGDITQKVLDACDAFAEKWPRSPWGPAHIVIDDQNVNDHHIIWVLKNFDKYAGDHDPEELEATRQFLFELLSWPPEEREPEK